MASIYAFQLSNGSFKVGQTLKDDPCDRLEKAFSTGSVLYRFFFVDPDRRHAIENLIHKELASFRDRKADGSEIFVPESKDTIDRLFDAWQDGEQQKIVLSSEDKSLLEEYAQVDSSDLAPPIPLDDTLAAWLELWRHHKSIATKHKKMYEIWEEQIKLRIRKSAGVEGEIDWKSSIRSSLDQGLVKEKYPDIFEECKKTSVVRRFTEVTGARKK